MDTHDDDDEQMNDDRGLDGRCSPAPSIYSYHSSVDGHMLREVHGRTLNSYNETYMLPVDSEEHSRLDLQHTMLTMALGSLYWPPDLVEKILAPRPDPSNFPSIIDIGTGSGTWAIAMAHAFPHAEVIGLDLVPPNLSWHESPIPQNCRFEIDDANLGFAHYPARFDVVHVRMCSIGITDYQAFLKEIAFMLKPGGIVLLVEGDFQLYSRDKEPLDPGANPGEPLFSWMEKVFFAAYNCMKTRGASIDARYLLPRWLDEMNEFENVETLKLFVPIGPWHPSGDKRSHFISELLRRNAMGMVQSLRPLLLSEGYFDDLVDRWISSALTELQELTAQLYSQWHFAWAVRKHDVPNTLHSTPSENTPSAAPPHRG